MAALISLEPVLLDVAVVDVVPVAEVPDVDAEGLLDAPEDDVNVEPLLNDDATVEEVGVAFPAPDEVGLADDWDEALEGL